MSLSVGEVAILCGWALSVLLSVWFCYRYPVSRIHMVLMLVVAVALPVVGALINTASVVFNPSRRRSSEPRS